VFIVNFVYREIYTDQQFYSESYKDFPNIQKVLPPNDSEQMDVDLHSNINEIEYFRSDCEIDSYSVKTQNYLEDIIIQTDLSSRAYYALKCLVENDVYHSKKRLFDF
jgi:hypothetical protein